MVVEVRTRGRSGIEVGRTCRREGWHAVLEMWMLETAVLNGVNCDEKAARDYELTNGTSGLDRGLLNARSLATFVIVADVEEGFRRLSGRHSRWWMRTAASRYY